MITISRVIPFVPKRRERVYGSETGVGERNWDEGTDPQTLPVWLSKKRETEGQP